MIHMNNYLFCVQKGWFQQNASNILFLPARYVDRYEIFPNVAKGGSGEGETGYNEAVSALASLLTH